MTTFSKQESIKVTTRAASGVPTPAANTLTLFADSANSTIKQKNSSAVVSELRITRHILFRVVEKATDWPANATTLVGGDLVIPFAGTITAIAADVDTAGTTGTAVVDVHLNGATIMSTTKLQWDSTEKSTRTFSGTAATLTTTAVALGDIIDVQVDTNHTTKSKGLTLYLAILPT